MAEAASDIQIVLFNGKDGVDRRGLLINYGLPQTVDVTLEGGVTAKCVMIDPIPQIVKAKDADGKDTLWDMANEPKPDAVGNNKSRNGFLWNCYTSILGDFFQRVVKGGIISLIRRIHDVEILKYDPQAYTYEDPRLIRLDCIITDIINEVIDDKHGARKREILHMCKDVGMFILKEDIFYRPRILKGMIKGSRTILENEETLSAVTEEEAYNLARFTGGIDHKSDFSDLPMEDRQKLPKRWTGLP